jgi:hypothetical protein
MDLKTVEKKIRGAWITGLVCGTITLTFSLLALFKNPVLLECYGTIDALIFYGLSFGIYKRNRVCAIIMIVFFIIEKIDLITRRTEEMMGGTGGIVFASVALVILVFFFEGIRGTFAYHKLKNK